MKKIIIGTMFSCTLAISSGDIVPVEPVVEAPVETSAWKHSVSIYGWLPTLDGTLRFNIPGEPGEPDEEAESSALDNLDMVFMGDYKARKDKWSFLVDVIYLKMSDAQEVYLPKIDTTIGSEQELTGWLVSVYGGYNIVDADRAAFDVIAGMRYFSLGLDVSLAVNDKSANASPSAEYYDALIGFKGAYNISDNWYIPYLFDIGGGDSDLTWQASTSLGYRFDWGDVLLTYRYIHYDYDSGEGLIEDLDFYGPKLGVLFHF